MILRIKSMWKMIKYNMISLLLFEAGYRVATFLIITNLTSTAVNYSLKKRNFSYQRFYPVFPIPIKNEKSIPVIC